MRRPFLVWLSLVALAGCSREVAAPPPAAEVSQEPTTVSRATFAAGGTTVNLPKAVGPWTRPDAPKVVTAETIFDYMDGGGELYLAYRFDHLDVFEYKAGEASFGTILVELYSMKHPDDAFGLLSTDWTGEVPAFDTNRPPPAPPAALYGAGLLRMCRDRLYARVLAARETPQAREAVLAIGREIAADHSQPPVPPSVVSGLPADAGESGTLRPDRTCFFRSHLVLNSAYYLSSEDILALGPDVAAVTTEYKPSAAGARPTRLILVRYPSPARAEAGLGTFTKAYLPERAAKLRPAASGAAQVEHGWVAWMQAGPDLAIALDAPSRAAATELAASTIKTAPAPGSASR